MKAPAQFKTISKPDNLPLIHAIGFHLAKACVEKFAQQSADYKIIHPEGDDQLEGWIVDDDWTCAMLRTHSGGRIGLTVYPMDCEFDHPAHYWVNTPEDAVAKYAHYLEHHN